MRNPKLAHILVGMSRTLTVLQAGTVFLFFLKPFLTFHSDFVKLVSKILYLFLADKMVVCCLCCCCCCCCLLQLCPILAYFFIYFLIEALIELRKML